MFTGLVQAIGVVTSREDGERAARVSLRSPDVAGEVAVGDSVAVAGTCLTVVQADREALAVDIVAETLRRTTLGELAPGTRVNLELALRAGDRLGGHIVQGHVDGVGVVEGARAEGESVVLRVGADPGLMRYVVEKGSIAVDGVSLTVAARDREGFAVALIPHTMSATTLGAVAAGRRVNLEVDVLAKYAEALIAPYAPEGEP